MVLCREIYQKGSRIRSKHCAILQELLVSANKKFYFFKRTFICDRRVYMAKTNWTLWALALRGRIDASQPVTYVSLFFGLQYSIISKLWKQFLSSLEVVQRFAAGRPMDAAFIGETISATTVRRRLHLNGMYTQVLLVCFSLPVQSGCAEICPATVCQVCNGLERHRQTQSTP